MGEAACPPLDGGGVFQAAIEPGLGQPPLAGHGGRRNSEDFRDLFNVQAREKPQFDEANLLGINGLQLFQGGVESNHVEIARALGSWLIAQADPFVATGALRRVPGARVVQQYPAHCLGSERKKLNSVLEGSLVLVFETQKHLVHQRGGAKRVVAAFPSKLPRRQAAELMVDQGEQFLGCLRAASAPRSQQFRQLLIGGLVHAYKFRTRLAAQSKGSPRSGEAA